jgi:hypothetical protein
MSRYAHLSELEIRRAVLVAEWTDRTLGEAVRYYKQRRRKA